MVSIYIVNSTVTIFLLAIVIMLIVNILYKFLIKQKEAKALKQRVNEIKDEMKKFQKEGDKEKTNDMLKEMLSVQNKLMRMTLKPMLISLIVFALFLPFINSMFGDVTVKLDNGYGDFSIAGSEYQLEKNENSINVIGAAEFSCQLPCRQNLHDYDWEVEQRGNDIVFARIITKLPVPMPVIGNELGWLGWYIICSIPIVIVLRKALKIYI